MAALVGVRHFIWVVNFPLLFPYLSNATFRMILVLFLYIEFDLLEFTLKTFVFQAAFIGFRMK